jgi:hypothetical protein
VSNSIFVLTDLDEFSDFTSTRSQPAIAPVQPTNVNQNPSGIQPLMPTTGNASAPAKPLITDSKDPWAKSSLFDLDSLGKDNYGKPASTSVSSPSRPTGNVMGNYGGNSMGYTNTGMNGMGMGSNNGAFA